MIGANPSTVKQPALQKKVPPSITHARVRLALMEGARRVFTELLLEQYERVRAELRRRIDLKTECNSIRNVRSQREPRQQLSFQCQIADLNDISRNAAKGFCRGDARRCVVMGHNIVL